MSWIGGEAFAELIDLVPASIVLRNADGLILAWNAASAALYGLDASAVTGRHVAVVFGDGAEPQGAIDILLRDGAWQGEVERIGADGGARHIELHWRLRQEGAEVQIVETGRDVTEAHRAGEALRKSEHRYRNLFQAMAASFWELDFFPVGAMLYQLRKAGQIADYGSYFAAHPEFVREMMRATRVIDVNDQTVALFGRESKQELLTSVEPFWPDASAHVFAGAVVAAVNGAPSFSTETVLRRIDGSEFPALFTACFPTDTMNKGTLLIGVIDLTERVAAEQALARMQAEMTRAARVSLLGELAASIAHEVNQPLGAIAANAAAGQRWLARDVPELDEVRAITTRIAVDAERAAATISRVRAMASGAAPVIGPIPVNEVAEDMATLLQTEVRQAGAQLTLSLSPGMPQVLADRVQLQQVIVNLVLNALQAQAPSVRLATTSGGEQVVLTVEDTGPGIGEADLPRLFESFFTTRPDGMGLGLAITRSIVERMDGTIRAENRAGGGARFVIVLPAHTIGAADNTIV